MRIASHDHRQTREAKDAVYSSDVEQPSVFRIDRVSQNFERRGFTAKLRVVEMLHDLFEIQAIDPFATDLAPLKMNLFGRRENF